MLVDMRTYTHLTTTEREAIFQYLSLGKSYREIGFLLKRSYTSISREVSRSLVVEDGQYSPSQAARAALTRRSAARRKKLDDPTLQTWVLDKLTRGWSPEQIAGRLKHLLGSEDPHKTVSYETIYQYIYARANRPGRYFEFLRRGHTRRQRVFGRRAHALKNLTIPNKTPIAVRPTVVNDRERFGDWETDLMEGKKATGEVVSVLTERKTGFILLDKLLSKEARLKLESLVRTLEKFKGSMTKTITFDNGTENFYHQQAAAALGCATYFCEPYHSWEKGTVENSIGLVRSYVPKGTSLQEVTQGDLNAVSHELNTRPRKRLDYLTPSESMLKETGWCASS